MDPNGFLKITDFGLACLLSQQEPLAHGTKGTPQFMAPELWRDEVLYTNSDRFLFVSNTNE